jgi:hypothetical protein
MSEMLQTPLGREGGMDVYIFLDRGRIVVTPSFAAGNRIVPPRDTRDSPET